MPARSQAQRAWAFGAKGSAWARKHHFDNPGKLPARSSKPRTKRKGDEKRQQMIAQFLHKQRGRHG
jgi:hypothetical protein